MGMMPSWPALAALGVGAASFLAPSSPLFPVGGVATADAKAFYTRKRVNGEWVEGRFPKATRARATSRRRGARAPVAAAPPAPMPPRPERMAAAETTASLETDRLATLHAALRARALAIAAAPAAKPAEGPSLPRALHLDFETGIKTTHFPGGAVVREPFDVAAMRPLASPPPASDPGLSAGLREGPDRRPPGS